MSDLLDVAAMRVRAQLAADANIADLRRRARKPLAPRLVQRVRAALATPLYLVGAYPLNVAWLATSVLWLALFVAASGSVTVMTTMCRAEDSAVTRVGVETFGCVWWGSLQGNGRGDTVWNRPTS